MDQVKFVEYIFVNWYGLKGCIPQILLGSFLNTLFHLKFYVARNVKNSESLDLLLNNDKSRKDFEM